MRNIIRKKQQILDEKGKGFWMPMSQILDFLGKKFWTLPGHKYWMENGVVLGSGWGIWALEGNLGVARTG